MEEMEVDCNEPLEECQEAAAGNAGSMAFKTPMTIDRSKLHPMYMRSDCHSASPDLHFVSTNIPCSTRMKRRNSRCQSMLFAPGDLSSGSLLSTSPESVLSSLSTSHSLGASPDSGIGGESFCSLVKDSLLGDSEEDVALLEASVKYPGTAEASSITERVEGVLPLVGDGHEPCQSTPVYEDARGLRPSFQDSCDLEPSPTKRRRASSRKSSRDLFQSNSKKNAFQWLQTLSSTAERPFLGRETVDFLCYLGKTSIHQPALDTILGYLEPIDLCRASVVSHTWKNIIASVPKAQHRKKEYLECCNQMKENLHQSTKKAEGALPIRGQLIAIQNFSRTETNTAESPRSPPVSPSKVRFVTYLKEGRKLESGQTLVQCPQCKLPARKETERSATCTRRGCQYHFCTLCLCKFHGEKLCPVSSVRHRKRPTAIGSRESKRNLQRLCKWTHQSP